MAHKRLRTARVDPRKVNFQLRETLRKKVYAAQDHCGICGYEVDKTLPAGTPLSPELDEIIPVARGGSPYDIDNLQLTHRRCNRMKGTKLMDEMKGDAVGEQSVNPTPISRDW